MKYFPGSDQRIFRIAQEAGKLSGSQLNDRSGLSKLTQLPKLGGGLSRLAKLTKLI